MSFVEPYEGFEYRTEHVSVSRDFQEEKLTACGLDPRVFGGHADPSFFIAMAIHAGINSGISAEGNVNMLQTLIQHRPVTLGEPLTVRGRITAVTEVPRGRTIDTDVRFEGADGAAAIVARRHSLKPDPNKVGSRGAGERPPPVIADPEALTVVAEHTLTPERVTRYSSEGNSIHYEMEAARRAGFRAPIIGGGMGVHFLTAALWPRFEPREIGLDIYFRRPIFWDDTVTVGCEAAGGSWHAIGLIKEGKVATEARIDRLA